MIVAWGQAPDGAPPMPFWHFGNKCGHDPARPLLDNPVPPPVDVPPVLVDRLGELDQIYYDRRVLPQLGKARSEIRESVVRLLKAIIPRMDVLTQRVGHDPDEHGRMAGLLIRTLETLTGLTYSRIRRALRRLVTAGLATRHRIWAELKDEDGKLLKDEDGDQRFGGRASAMHLAGKIFRALKWNMRLGAAAKRAWQQRKKAKAAAAAAEPAAAIGRNAVQGELAQLARSMDAGKYFGPTESNERIRRHVDRAGFNDKVTAEGRRLVDLKLQLRQAHPDWTPEQIAAAVEPLK